MRSRHCSRYCRLASFTRMNVFPRFPQSTRAVGSAYIACVYVHHLSRVLNCSAPVQCNARVCLPLSLLLRVPYHTKAFRTPPPRLSLLLQRARFLIDVRFHANVDVRKMLPGAHIEYISGIYYVDFRQMLRRFQGKMHDFREMKMCSVRGFQGKCYRFQGNGVSEK